MIQYIADKEHKGPLTIRKGEARPVDWYRRLEESICWQRQECGSVPLNPRQVAETWRRCASAARQRTERELSRRPRQVSWLVEQVGTEALSAGAFQDNDIRLRHRLHRFRQPHWCRHRHERRQQPQLRGRNPHRRAPIGRCRRRPPRQRMARPTMCQVQTKSQ